MKQKYASAIPNAVVGVLPHFWNGYGTNSELASCLNTGAASNYSGCDAVATKAESPSLNYESGNAVTAGPYNFASATTNQEVDFNKNGNFNSAMGATGNLPAHMKFLFYGSLPSMIAGANNKDTDVTTDYTLLQYSETCRRIRTSRPSSAAGPTPSCSS